ncbi:MAG: acyl-ACP desaturase, partial [Flavobacteriaceae bacterium]
MRSLEPKIDEFIEKFLIPIDTIWQPTDFLPDSQSEDFFKEITEIQEG